MDHTAGLHVVHGKASSGKTSRLRHIVKDALNSDIECWVYSMPPSSSRHYKELQVHATWRDLLPVLRAAQARMRQAPSAQEPQPLLLVLDSLDDVVPGTWTTCEAELEALADLAEHCAAADIRLMVAVQTLDRLPHDVLTHAVTVHNTSVDRASTTE